MSLDCKDIDTGRDLSMMGTLILVDTVVKVFDLLSNFEVHAVCEA